MRRRLLQVVQPNQPSYGRRTAELRRPHNAISSRDRSVLMPFTPYVRFAMEAGQSRYPPRVIRVDIVTSATLSAVHKNRCTWQACADDRPPLLAALGC